MYLKFLRILHSISLRLPQMYQLRSGVKVASFGTQYNNLFWVIFTSKEYNQLMRTLIRENIRPNLIIDCGAACGYFTLLIRHMTLTRLLDWDNLKYHVVEPNSANVRKLKINLALNFTNDEVVIHEGLAGKKDGGEFFFISKGHPWGSSINKREDSKKAGFIPYIDLTGVLQNEKSLLKLDIEGGEFDFIDSYKSELSKVLAIIIEWHDEFGDKQKAMDTLNSIGFKLSDTSFQKGNRSVQLYLHETT